MLLDFFNLYLVAMYILHFRNPLLVKSMRKVFWHFPMPSDSHEQIKRLDHDVLKQIKWQAQPLPIGHVNYEKQREEIRAKKGKRALAKIVKHAEQEYAYERDLGRRRLDLNEVLVTYVDLKFQNIWSS